MKVMLTSEEWYPVFVEAEDYDEVEIPDDLWERYTEAKDEFVSVRAQLHNYLEDQGVV